MAIAIDDLLIQQHRDDVWNANTVEARDESLVMALIVSNIMKDTKNGLLLELAKMLLCVRGFGQHEVHDLSPGDPRGLLTSDN